MSRLLHRFASAGLWLASAALSACGGSSSLPSADPSAVTQPFHPAPSKTFVGWLQPGLDAAHTANNTAEKTLTRQNVGTLALGWSVPVGAGVGTPTVTDGSTAYVASGDDYLYALDMATGAQKWRFQTSFYGESGSWIAIAGGTIYAAPCFVGSNTQGAGLCALSTKTGKLKWSWYASCNCGPLPSIVVGPVVSNATVVFAYHAGGAYGKMYVIALSAASGALLWQTVAGDGNPSGSMGPNLPAISGGNVYVGTDTGICSLTLTGGSVNWCSGPNAMSGSPAVSKGVVYVTNGNTGSGQPSLYALNATTGAQVWQYAPTGGYFGYADPPAIAGGKAYFASNEEGPIYALNATNGSLLFTFGAGSQNAKTLSSPSIANGVVYVACYTGLCAYDSSTGASLLTIGNGGSGYGAPAVANGEVILPCANRNTGYCSSNGFYGVAMYHLPALRSRYEYSKP